MVASIAHEWLDDVMAEFQELGLDEMMPYARDLAVIAAYVTERDDAIASGLSHRWLVDGPKAPRLGVNCSSRRKALSYLAKFGAGHTIRIGYGDLYRWRAINVDALVRMARRVAA